MVNHAYVRAIMHRREQALPVSEPRPFETDLDSTISLTELRERLGDPALTIVDVRALPAYNGWRSSLAARGGPIPGAVAFPIAWLGTVDRPEVERLLQAHR